MNTGPIHSIDENSLLSLMDNRVSEGKTIEYKERLPGNSDGDKKEFLADISSFANSAGGDLFIGIKEDAGIPKAITGLQIEDIDIEIGRLENVIRDGIEPRIWEITIRAIPLHSSNNVIVIRVPRSWALPHMVSYPGL